MNLTAGTSRRGPRGITLARPGAVADGSEDVLLVPGWRAAAAA